MDDAEILALERQAWDALCTPDGAAFYRKHLAAEAVMVFPFGRMERGAAIDAMAGAEPWQDYAIEDPRVVWPNKDTAAISYRAVAHREGQPEYRAWMTSVWVQGGDGWRMVLHQQSPEMSA